MGKLGLALRRWGREHISPREVLVLSLIREGKTSRQVAEELGLAYHTVERHVAVVMEKLNVHSRIEAVRALVECGVLK